MTNLPQRPNTYIPVMLTAIMGALQIINGAQNAPSPDQLFASILNIAVGVVLLIGAFLIYRYKRAGLILCAIIDIYLLATYALVIAAGGSIDIVSLIAGVAIVIVLIFLYRYLAGAKEKPFFT